MLQLRWVSVIFAFVYIGRQPLCDW